MYFVETTYQLQKEEIPQINLQNLPQVGLIRKDSVTTIDISRTHFNILELDTTVPRRFREVTPKKTEKPKVLTSQDSLLLNLTGNTHAFTNLQMSLTPKTGEFNETAFSRFDSSLIKTSTENIGHSFFVSDSLEKSPINKSDRPGKNQQNFYIEKGEVQPDSLITQERPLREDWLLAVLVISVLISGFARLNWRRYLNNVIQSIFFQNSMGKLEGSNASNLYPSFILGSLFYLNSSIFIYQILTLSGRPFLGFDSFVVIPLLFVFLLLLFSLKGLAYKIIGHVFETKNQVNEYIFGSSTMSKAYAIIILPVIVFIPFVSESIQPMLIKVGSGVFILLYLIQIARGVKIILTNTLSVYYIILYLCALEILPLSILLKVIFH